ncbi:MULTISPECIES: hypothetical protein [Elizabethkingia]|nr:hypothetical protein [Elizabethkingia anophelis]ATC37753.1 hypothetical protein BAZ09_016550 [Elizabethkingia anophelis R26]ATC41433.1 hypothetical protein EAAG1_016765 [Elizabethkingia anophelis Ag1]ATC45110.1 hypothetical protein CMV41_16765 [Elizabethkingia anophelis]ATC48786.1 hypothetical protein CMV40_16765 [Elizabethkingia anophelis]KMU62264.1 hypothetical protein EZBTHKR_2234 [Elizabethkingia anophelis]
MGDKIKELESILSELEIKTNKRKKKLIILYILIEIVFTLLLVLYHFVMNKNADSFNSFIHITLPILTSLLMLPLILDFFTGLSVLQNKQKRLVDEINYLKNIQKRTFYGEIHLITGEKVEGVFIKPFFDSDPYFDKQNRTEYFKDKIISVKKIDNYEK